MLGKLIKYEWKNTYKVGGLMLIVLAVNTFMGWLALQAPMWRASAGKSIGDFALRSGWLLTILSIFTLIMYVITMVGIVYGLLIYLGVHFYKTMYTDEGYLTHTLPVEKHQILVSKVLIGGAWMFLESICVIMSICVLVMTLIGMFKPDGYTMAELWTELMYGFNELYLELDADLAFALAAMLISLILAPFTSTVILFGAISLGQLFTKVRVLMAIVCYIGIMVLENLLNSIVQAIGRGIAGYSYYFGIIMNSNIIVSVLLAVGLYFVSYYIIKNKLNME